MTTRPNILFIMADDHAARAIGAYGHGLAATPGIDRIAQGGVRLDHCYVTNSICTFKNFRKLVATSQRRLED